MTAPPGRLDGWTLRRRLTAALTVGSLLTVLVVACVGILLAQVRGTQQKVVQDFFDGYSISNDLYVRLVNSETAVRGYALTGEESFLAPYEQGDAAAAKSYDRLVRLISDEPELRRLLEAASASAARWTEEWAEPTRRQVQAEGAMSVSAADIARGRALFDEVRRDFLDYRAAFVAERGRELDRLELLNDLLYAAVVLAVVGAAVIATGLWVALHRWVTRPVEELAAESREVSRGHLEHGVRVDGPPEFVALARDVEAMRRVLLSQLGVVDAARTEAEQARSLLQAQAMELERSNQELEQFAYVASHDLQEPLRKVASFCQMLERRYKGQLDERADQYIAFAVDGAKRMQQLINDLLMFSRVGRLGPDWSDVELDACLAQALRNLEAAREESAAEITADPLPVVRGEPGLLTQLFQNLVGNGIKFRGERPPRVHIGVRRTGDVWELSCSDNGIGIEPQYAERIFVIFQRLHPKDEYDGTGIGLALCKKIVEYHRGRIWLEASPAGDGTTFRWTLPVRAYDAEPRTDETPPVEAAAGGGHQHG